MYSKDLVTVTDVRGRVVSWSSAGTCGFRGTRRGTPFAAQTAAANAIRAVVDQGMQRAEVMIKGPGLGRDAALRAIRIVILSYGLFRFVFVTFVIIIFTIKNIELILSRVLGRMAESLIDLEQVLRSKKEKLTSEEANFLMTWKGNTLQQLTVGGCAGGAVAWSATGNLNRMLRINLAGGAAALTAAWRFKWSVNSCIEQILCMDGSRMQRELANIILKRYPNHPMTTKLISKRFYCENVFDDSTSDIPKSRWRFRNTFVESPPHPQRTEENHESHDHDARTGPQLNPLPMKNGFIAMENPFDCIFGVPPSVEEIRRPVSAKSPRKHNNRKQRRSQRRHHIHKDDHDYS